MKRTRICLEDRNLGWITLVVGPETMHLTEDEILKLREALTALTPEKLQQLFHPHRDLLEWEEGEWK